MATLSPTPIVIDGKGHLLGRLGPTSCSTIPARITTDHKVPVVIPDEAEAALSFGQICRGAWREGGRACGRRRRRGSAQGGTVVQPRAAVMATGSASGSRHSSAQGHSLCLGAQGTQ
ncbi:hypothetical protein C8J57DRAFT_1226243 [Mycena rebaudengoi]|nr:hypothetical protein C8J57DRAFT_1226243 [Mycena rebaudengoi]